VVNTGSRYIASCKWWT